MKKTILILSLLISSFLISSGCKTYSKDDKNAFNQKIEKFLKKHKLTKYKHSESGLYYYVKKEGTGDYIKLTDNVSFTYVGKLINGQLFDGEHQKKPVSFPVIELIEGWKEGMLYLKKGGKAKLIIPPYLGYGDYDLEKIPPHSVLVFEVEVVDVK